jgi:dCMP deaminase
MDYDLIISYMDFACEVAQMSVDPSVQNGAVVVSRSGAIVTGFNGLTKGVVDGPDKWERPQKYMWVEHAERHAILNAAKAGISLDEAVMFCPWASCADCARAIVASGIIQLYRLPMGKAEDWAESIKIGDHIMAAAGVSIITLPLEEISYPDGLRLGQFRK